MAGEYTLAYTAKQIDENLGKAGQAVLYTEQALTSAQKKQARDNIDAPSKFYVEDIANITVVNFKNNYVDVLPNVTYEAQTLTPEQKVQARNNIGAMGMSAILSTHVFSTSEVTRGHVNKSGGLTSSNNWFTPQQYVPVQSLQGEDVAIKSTIYSNASVAFYDKDKKVILCVSENNIAAYGYTTGLQAMERVLPVPADAAYVWFSVYSADNIYKDDMYIKLPADISALQETVGDLQQAVDNAKNYTDSIAAVVALNAKNYTDEKVASIEAVNNSGGFGSFIQNTDIDYAFDSATNANYTIIRIYKNRIDGTKQFPFVYAPKGVNSGTMTTYDLATSEGWLLAINAGVFDTSNCKPDGIVIQNGEVVQRGETVAHSQCKPLTIDQQGNLGYAEYNADADTLISSGIVSAVTGFMPIIVDYEPVPSTAWNSVDNYTQNAQRQIIGQFGNGDYAIITCEGRGFDNSDGWTITEAQTICQKHGLKFAYNLDGGGSTETMLGYKPINTIYEGTTGRKVPTFIVFNGKNVFDGNTPEDPAILPDGYTELSYIVVPNGAYIDTGIPATADYDAEGKQQAGSAHVLSSQNYFYPTLNEKGENRYCRYLRYGAEQLLPFAFSYEKDYAWKVTGETVEVDGTILTTTAIKGSMTPTGNLYLFCYGGDPTNTNYHFAGGRFYYLRLYDKISGDLLYEYLPCKNESGVVGLYETVNGTFYGSDTDVAFLGE